MYELKERAVWGLPTNHDIHCLFNSLNDALIEQNFTIHGGMDLDEMRELAVQVASIFEEEYKEAQIRSTGTNFKLFAF